MPRHCGGAEEAALLRGRDLGDHALERLVGLLGEIGVEFTHLGRFRDEALISRLDVVALDLPAFDRKRGNLAGLVASAKRT